MTDDLTLTNLYRRLDLYHLKVLKILLEECNTSKTAERLAVTQSAVSKCLARLRDVFDDELFVRGKGQMVPTPRALGLRDKLDAIFAQVNEVILPVAFEPESYHGVFRLAMMEQMMPVIVGPLVEAVQRQAPGIELKIMDLSEGYRRREENYADFFICYDGGALSWRLPGYEHQTLLDVGGMTALVNQQHPLLGKEINLSDYLQANHVLPRLRAPNTLLEAPIQYFLQQAEVERHLIVECNQILVLLDVLQRTDALFTCSEFEVQVYRRVMPQLQQLDLSRVHAELGFPQLSYSLQTRAHLQKSPPHRWLAQLIAKLVPILLDDNRKIKTPG